MRVRFACRHEQDVEGTDSVPVCATCGERRVAHVQAPAPKFIGVCQGPSATFVPLPGIGVNLGSDQESADD